MTMGFFPDDSDRMLADAARRAFDGASDPERAVDGLEILQPVGAGIDLVSAATVVREAARRAMAYPLAEALVLATVTGRTAPAADMRAAFGTIARDGRILGAGARLLVPEAGRTLLVTAAPGTPPRDPLQAVAWADAATANAQIHAVETRPIAWTLLAAGILGAGEALLEATVTHLRQREQFGRPLGSFQSLRHRAAGDWVRLEDIRAAVDLAAVAFDAGDNAGALEAARIAKAIASDHGPLVAENAIHAHGAMGFTWEAGLHPHLVAIRHSAAALGRAADHFAVIGTAQIETRDKDIRPHERA